MAGSHAHNPGQNADQNTEHSNDFQRWLSSEEGQQPVKASDAIRGLLEDVELDVGQRSFLWPDGQPRSFDESVAHLHQGLPQVANEELANLLIDWMEDPERMEESASQERSGNLERVLDDWIDELDQQHPIR